jgi:hypothetical protein
MTKSTPLAALLLLAVGLPACDGSSSGTDVGVETGGDVEAEAESVTEVPRDGLGPEEAEPEVEPDVVPEVPEEAEAGGDGDLPACEHHSGVVADSEMAGSGPTLIEYRAYMGTEVPYEVLRVQIMGDNVGRVDPGVYDLAGTSYETCEVCVSILTDCAVGPCGHFLYPLAGTIEILAIGDEGERFAGRLAGIEMAEFEILPDGVGTEPLPDGDDWCIDDYEFDRIASSTHDAICDRPVVPCLGETLLDFSLESCATGEMVSMSSLAAGNQALVYSMVTGWCPYCGEWMATLTGYQTAHADDGLEVAYVYGEDDGGNSPSAAECLAYAARHGADPDDFYLDHDGTASFATTTFAMWPWLVTSETMSLPWTTIIDAETYEYVYTNQADPDNSEFESTMLGLLGL